MLLIAGSSQRMTSFDPSLYHVGFIVVNKVAIGRVFSEYIRFRYQFLFHQLLPASINHPIIKYIGYNLLTGSVF
jgi:hypothetical protein